MYLYLCCSVFVLSGLRRRCHCPDLVQPEAPWVQPRARPREAVFFFHTFQSLIVSVITIIIIVIIVIVVIVIISNIFVYTALSLIASISIHHRYHQQHIFSTNCFSSTFPDPIVQTACAACSRTSAAPLSLQLMSPSLPSLPTPLASAVVCLPWTSTIDHLLTSFLLVTTSVLSSNCFSSFPSQSITRRWLTRWYVGCRCLPLSPQRPTPFPSYFLPSCHHLLHVFKPLPFFLFPPNYPITTAPDNAPFRPALALICFYSFLHKLH